MLLICHTRRYFMSINLSGIFEQTIAGIIAGVAVWLLSLVASEKSRRFSRFLWKWLQFRWRIIVILLYITLITIIIHVTFSDPKVTIITSGAVSLWWVVYLLIRRSRTERVLFYDFRKTLQEWRSAEKWIPEIDPVKGIKLEDHANLSKYVISPELDFSIGTIEYDAILEAGAILNVIFRGKIGTSFYMARLDARANDQYIYDCILFSPKGNTGWDICNKSTKQFGHTSSVGEKMNVKLVCTRKTATLIVNGYQVDMFSELQTKITGGQVFIFAEKSNAYVQKIQISKPYL